MALSTITRHYPLPLHHLHDEIGRIFFNSINNWRFLSESDHISRRFRFRNCIFGIPGFLIRLKCSITFHQNPNWLNLNFEKYRNINNICEFLGECIVVLCSMKALRVKMVEDPAYGIHSHIDTQVWDVWCLYPSHQFGNRKFNYCFLCIKFSLNFNLRKFTI